MHTHKIFTFFIFFIKSGFSASINQPKQPKFDLEHVWDGCKSDSIFSQNGRDVECMQKSLWLLDIFNKNYRPNRCTKMPVVAQDAYGRQVVSEMKDICEPWKGQCKADYQLTKLDSGTRFVLKMQIYTFGMQLRNTCGDTKKCNLIGWLNQAGQLVNFDFDCVEDEEGKMQLEEEKRIRKIENEKMNLMSSIGSHDSIGQVMNVLNKVHRHDL